MTAALGGETTLACILGRCDSLRAEVFFRAALPSGSAAAGATLAGTLAGPECRRAITLPVTARLAAVTDGAAAAATDAVVARAILTEPAYWTPELPNLYRLDARLELGGRELARWRQPIGLRRFGVRGRSLWLDGRRYVPRGLAATHAIDLAAFREAALTAVVRDPSEALLAECDAAGVAVIGLLADASGRPFDVAAAIAAIARWARHPAVLVAVMGREGTVAACGEIATATRHARGTLLLACEADGSGPPPAVPAGVELLVVTMPAAGMPHEAWRDEPPGLPLIAWRPAPPAEASATGPPSRRECDSLQAALAGWGTAGSGPVPDWAGYLTGRA